jgi:hypothetical protein
MRIKLDLARSLLQNAAKIRQTAHTKHRNSSVRATLSALFGRLAGLKDPFSEMRYQIGDLLSLFVTIVEVFSEDPICLLLDCGLVIFPDSVCVNLEILSTSLERSNSELVKLFQESDYVQIGQFPEYCWQGLLSLGYITSMNFAFFMIPQTDAFSLHIRKFPFVVQPFPLEFVDVLQYAKRQESVKRGLDAGEFVFGVIARCAPFLD